MKNIALKNQKKSSQKSKNPLQSRKKSVVSKSFLWKTRRQREKQWQKLTKKMETERFQYLVKELDRVFSIYIRNRDRNNTCVTFWVRWCHNKIQHNCHFIGRWYYSHRRDEDNCFWGCWYCNTYAQEEHKIQYTIFMIKRFGSWYVDEMLLKRNRSKPSIEFMRNKIDYYKALI